RIGGGYYTFPHLAEQNFSKQKQRELYTAIKPKTQGVYSFGFFGFINEEWNIGVTLSLENLSGGIERKVYDTSVLDTVVARADYRVKAISIFPTAQKYWKQSKMLNLYSGVGLGIS